MKNPKLTVIIPTRERADTLFHTLRTVVEQDYENLEIIVSDNASIDNTEAIVRSFSDSRLNYINTGQRLGMSENWEFALGHVKGDFVMYLGDDDGLLPEACSDVAKIISLTDTKAIIWNKPDYNWPSNKIAPNGLNIKLNYDLVEMDGKILLKAVADGRTSYGRLPVIYSGFVAIEKILQIKNKTSRFFHSITPDVYSGIVLADALPSYLYSFRPFSINGGSGHSNGLATMTNDDRGKLFFSESRLEINAQIPIIRGSIQTHVAEAFLQAQKVNLLQHYKLNFQRVHKNIFNEVKHLSDPLRSNGLQVLMGMNIDTSLRKKIENELQNENIEQRSFVNSPQSENKIINIESGHLSLNAALFSIQNSYDACIFIGNLLGQYKMPEVTLKANTLSYAISIVRRKMAVSLKKYLLPF
jgi:glycosyltransferase involved in cell wall biosynthesis